MLRYIEIATTILAISMSIISAFSVLHINEQDKIINRQNKLLKEITSIDSTYTNRTKQYSNVITQYVNGCDFYIDNKKITTSDLLRAYTPNAIIEIEHIWERIKRREDLRGEFIQRGMGFPDGPPPLYPVQQRPAASPEPAPGQCTDGSRITTP